MVRVGTCKDCGARFKVPEATRATKARCKKCGGTVEIPPAEGGADAPPKPAAKPAAPAAAPAAKKPAAPAPKPAPKPAAKPAEKPAAKKRAAPAKGAAPAKRRVPGKAAAPAAAGAASKSRASGKAAGAPTRGAGTKSPRRAAPGKAAPAKGKPAAAGKSLERSKSPGKARGKAAVGAKGAGGGGRKGRAGGAAKSEEKKSPMLLILIIALVVIGGGAGWFFWPKGDDTGTDGASDDTAAVGTEDGEDGAGADTAAPPVVIDDPDMADPADDAAGDDMAMAPEPMAPPPEDKPSNEPVDPILEFDLLPPNPGISQEQHDEWSALVKEYYLESPPPRTAKKLRVELEELDPVDAAPAYINALIGLDMRDDIDTRDAFKLIEEWQDKGGKKVHFYFPDASRMEDDDIQKRAKAALNWVVYWEEKQTDIEKLDDLKRKIAERLAELAAQK
ncbi:MAG: zinc ribbon domain-containing protein [Planctomycetota bacterium]|jgi:hypothetical protein